MTSHTMGCWSLIDDSLDLGPGCGVDWSRVWGGREPAAEVAAALRAQVDAGWRHLAACAGTDPDVWFQSEDESEGEPSTGSDQVVELLVTCAGCLVRRSCLASALLHVESGVWAGTTPATRAEAGVMLAAGAPADTLLDELLTRAREKAGTADRSARHAAGQPGRAA